MSITNTTRLRSMQTTLGTRPYTATPPHCVRCGVARNAWTPLQLAYLAAPSNRMRRASGRRQGRAHNAAMNTLRHPRTINYCLERRREARKAVAAWRLGDLDIRGTLTPRIDP